MNRCVGCIRASGEKTRASYLVGATVFPISAALRHQVDNFRRRILFELQESFWAVLRSGIETEGVQTAIRSCCRYQHCGIGGYVKHRIGEVVVDRNRRTRFCALTSAIRTVRRAREQEVWQKKCATAQSTWSEGISIAVPLL